MNPYHYGSPVSGDRFTDRREELSALVTCMTRSQNVVLLSPRRYGKSSLLRRAVTDVRHAGGRVALVNLIGCSNRRQVAQALATCIAQGVLGGLEGRVEQLREHLASIRAGVSVALTPEGVKVTLAPLQAQSDWSDVIGDVLRMLAPVGSRRRPVSLVFDEFQRVAEIDDGLAGVFKTLVDELEPIGFVFAGSKRHLMERLSTGVGAPLLRIGTRISLAPIERSHMVTFLSERAQAGKKEMTAEVAGGIFDLARGIPNDVQQLAFWAFEEPGRRIDAGAVQRGLERLVSLQAVDFASNFEKLAPSQQRIMEGLARGPVNDVYSRQFMENVEVLNPNAVRVALRRLNELEMIDRGPGGWRVASVFFEHWLAAESPT